MVRDEGAGGCAAIDGLKHGRFHFQKSTIIEELAQCLDGGCALAEDLAHIRVDGEVGVALTGAQLGVFEGGVAQNRTIRQGLILGGGEGTDGLGEQLEVLHMQGNLTGLGAEHESGRLDEVADIDELVEEVDALLSEVVRAEEELHLACAVFEVCEGDLSHGTCGPDAPGKSDLDFLTACLAGFEGRDGLGAGVRAFRACGVDLHALRAQLIDLLQTNLFERRVFCHEFQSRSTLSAPDYRLPGMGRQVRVYKKRPRAARLAANARGAAL